MAVIYTRGRALKTAITALFVVVAAASLLTMAVQLVMSASGGSQPDLGWGVVARGEHGTGGLGHPFPGAVAVAVGCLIEDGPIRPHPCGVGLLALVVLLVVGLKTGSPDRDAYKNLVFGEGGLVEWSQVLVLVLASRTAWLIGSDLNARLQERRPGRLFQGGAACLAWS